MASLVEVAQRAGVSVATASRALNPGRHPVRATTANRVREAALALGFRPNGLARGLRQSWARTVGVVVHDVSDPYFAETARGVADAALASGFLTSICNTERDPAEELRYVGMLCESRVAGVLFAGGGLDDPGYRAELKRSVAELRGYGAQVVALGPRKDKWPAEIPDNHGGARLAAAHLLALGHREIAVIGGPPGLRTTSEREAGFQLELEAAGVQIDPRLRAAGRYDRESGEQAMHGLLDSGEDFTAVFAENDAMAIGCLKALAERRVRVPEDISLIGFGDIPLMSYFNPPISTIAVHMRQIGVAGMERLEALLNGTDRGSRVRVHPTQLVARASTAPPRRKRFPTLSVPA
ncbi:MAG: LacI family DNA-binding transcriptional regulator [Chloroflexota bacterium]|nr:LacI family DNA-binding transcriptional regulator [Chloroflexota bacterium]